MVCLGVDWRFFMAKRIFITGGARRLGKTLTEHYLSEGWSVVAHYNTRSELDEHPGLTLLRADLSNPSDIALLCQQLPEHGPFDAVIHNASCFVPDSAASDLASHVAQHQNVHVTAPVMITEAIGDSWADSACMISISDIYAEITEEFNGIFGAILNFFDRLGRMITEFFKWILKVLENIFGGIFRDIKINSFIFRNRSFYSASCTNFPQ